ncbi:MAG: polysaccharide deacetylase family protein [Eubacteriales bacterium]
MKLLEKDSIRIQSIGFILLLIILLYAMGFHVGKVVDVVNTNLISNYESLSWGLGFGESGTTPTGNTSADELLVYDSYYVGDESEMVLYLTFDAGYENGNTEAILDALLAHDAKATFFLVGNYLETNPELVIRMVEEGHTIGNHSYYHKDMTTLSEEEFIEELESLETLFTEITGEEMSNFYRPPQGKYSIETLKLAQSLGYETIFWSLAYVDWYVDDQPTKIEAFDKLLVRVHPGAIVLLHSTSQTNGEIMDELLTQWEDMGYSFGSLEDL